MRTLLLATRNRHKLEEIRAILGADNRYLSLANFPDAPTVEEDADSFAGNAAKKALALARWLGAAQTGPAVNLVGSDGLVVADDSGLEVDALKGAPGVRSARFAGPESGRQGNSPDAANNAKLLRLLADVPADRRTARFRCVVAVAVLSPDEKPQGRLRLFEGVCEGRIGFEPRGSNGFGYDPLFIPTGFEQTFAELGEATKNAISHRARALAALRDWLAGR